MMSHSASPDTVTMRMLHEQTGRLPAEGWTDPEMVSLAILTIALCANNGAEKRGAAETFLMTEIVPLLRDATLNMSEQVNRLDDV